MAGLLARDRMWIVRTTLGTMEQARELAGRLVGLHLAACVHIQPIQSIYRWKGAVQDDAEFLVEARVIRSREADVRKAMLEGHPYEEPLVESFEVRGLPPGYLQWATHGTGP